MLSTHATAKLLINDCGEIVYLVVLQAEDLHAMLTLGSELCE